MPAFRTTAHRVRWMDGLRGLAAMQVLLLHLASAFLPELGTLQPGALHFRWERLFLHTPAFFILDGYSAVYVFFLLSGAALTYSFGLTPLRIGYTISRRLTRLGIPMLAAVAWGTALLALAPDLHRQAAVFTGSEHWFGAVSPAHVTLGLALHQALLEGMLTGYVNITVLPHHLATQLGLVSVLQSVNAPLWTLHLELMGSLLVLALVGFRHIAGAHAHLWLCLALLPLTASNPMVLFVLGHLLAPLLRHATNTLPQWARGVGLILLAAGIGLTARQDWPLLAVVLRHLPALLQPEDLFHFSAMVPAMLVFLGIAALPGLHRVLSTRPFLWLGRLSFGLYLVHFPVLFTLGGASFLALRDAVPYGAAAAIASLLTALTSLALAAAFTRFVDQPAIRLSQRINAPQQ